MKTKLTLLILCFCSSVFSESYVVTSYSKEGELFSQVFKRSDSSFLLKVRLGERELYKGFYQGLDIIYEKNDLLILGKSTDTDGIEGMEGMEGIEFYYIDKKLRKFYKADLTRLSITLLDSGKLRPAKVQDLVIISD